MSTKKIGWGTGIAALYGGFVVLIIVLVAGSMRQRYDLVSPDYYEQELSYQDVINAGKNQSGLSAPVGFQVDERSVVLVLPAECSDEQTSGTIRFYAPADNRWDKTVPLVTRNNRAVIPRSALHATGYVVKINWTTGGREYYQESVLNLYRP